MAVCCDTDQNSGVTSPHIQPNHTLSVYRMHKSTQRTAKKAIIRHIDGEKCWNNTVRMVTAIGTTRSSQLDTQCVRSVTTPRHTSSYRVQLCGRQCGTTDHAARQTMRCYRLCGTVNRVVRQTVWCGRPCGAT